MAEAQQSGQIDMSDVQIIFSPTTTEKETPLDLDELARDFQTNTDWNIPEAYMALILSADSSLARTVSRKPVARFPATCVFQSLRIVWTSCWPTASCASPRPTS